MTPSAGLRDDAVTEGRDGVPDLAARDDEAATRTRAGRRSYVLPRAVLMGVAAAGADVWLRVAGMLEGPLALVLAVVLLLAVPTGESLSRRIVLAGPLAIGWVPVLWWWHMPVGALGRVTILIAVLAEVLTGWCAAGLIPRQRARADDDGRRRVATRRGTRCGSLPAAMASAAVSAGRPVDAECRLGQFGALRHDSDDPPLWCGRLRSHSADRRDRVELCGIPPGLPPARRSARRAAAWSVRRDTRGRGPRVRDRPRADRGRDRPRRGCRTVCAPGAPGAAARRTAARRARGGCLRLWVGWERARRRFPQLPHGMRAAVFGPTPRRHRSSPPLAAARTR